MPDHALCVFEADSGRLLVKQSTADAGDNSSGNTVSFDPKDGLHLCTSGEGRIAFWRIEENFDSYAITK